jgi:flagellin-like protein
MKKRGGKIKNKGVSPVIATVLLIAIVIVLALIVFLWARGFLGEKAQKEGRAVELSCIDTNFDAQYFQNSGEWIDVINRGNVPIFGFDLRAIGDGTVLTHSRLGSTLDQGESGVISIEGLPERSFLVVPVILGESKSEKVEYPCPEQYGVAVSKP